MKFANVSYRERDGGCLRLPEYITKVHRVLKLAASINNLHSCWFNPKFFCRRIHTMEGLVPRFNFSSAGYSRASCPELNSKHLYYELAGWCRDYNCRFSSTPACLATVIIPNAFSNQPLRSSSKECQLYSLERALPYRNMHCPAHFSHSFSSTKAPARRFPRLLHVAGRQSAC